MANYLNGVRWRCGATARAGDTLTHPCFRGSVRLLNHIFEVKAPDGTHSHSGSCAHHNENQTLFGFLEDRLGHCFGNNEPDEWWE